VSQKKSQKNMQLIQTKFSQTTIEKTQELSHQFLSHLKNKINYKRKMLLKKQLRRLLTLASNQRIFKEAVHERVSSQMTQEAGWGTVE